MARDGPPEMMKMASGYFKTLQRGVLPHERLQGESGWPARRTATEMGVAIFETKHVLPEQQGGEFAEVATPGVPLVGRARGFVVEVLDARFFERLVHV